MNVEKLKELAHANPTAELMFTAWACKERNRKRIDIRRQKYALAKEMPNFDQQAYYKTLEALTGVGVGSISKSVKGKPRYFHWTMGMNRVGQLGLGYAEAEKKRKVKAEKQKVHTLPQLQTVYVQLLSGRLIPVSLPASLTEADATNVCKAIHEMVRFKNAHH